MTTTHTTDATETTYRAAYWTDGQSEVRLTDEEMSHLSDDALMAAAVQEAESTGLEMGEGEILIAEWRD